MLVSIIIVNYNTFELTCNCIDSILGHTKGIDYEIIVVDNASPNENPDAFKTKYPSIKLIKSAENGGFAKGNNIGIANAAGNVILLLNSDTILTADSISASAKQLSALPDAGFLSCKLVYQDGKYQHNARAFRSIRNELLDIIRPVLMLLPYEKRARLMLNQYFHGDFDTPCDWVSGAFMMFNTSLLVHLPGNRLDERFFMYGEDELWCLQAFNAGYSNYYTSCTSVIHIANASTEPAKQQRLMKTMLKHSIEIMRSRYGSGLYFKTLVAIYTFKENMRYAIKVLVMKLFKYRIR